jgi:hypothetical protein
MINKREKNATILCPYFSKRESMLQFCEHVFQSGKVCAIFFGIGGYKWGFTDSVFNPSSEKSGFLSDKSSLKKQNPLKIIILGYSFR